ncbi:hypothetical protein H0H87_002073 [Tephrocybe sp. NHM501043]|nr:hypothetical protein H0H87_002073 [Tephrocybe sp. NHM501043]
MPILNVHAGPAARILIYSATAGYRHDSIPAATTALKSKGSSINVIFDATEDKTQFTVENLSRYDALLFLSTTGEVLDSSGKAALQTYLNLGGNFIGIHSASDTISNTTFYGHEVGAFFDYHPELQNAIVNVLDKTHPSTSIYNFKSDPRTIGATVILAADESSYTKGLVNMIKGLLILSLGINFMALV